MEPRNLLFLKQFTKYLVWSLMRIAKQRMVRALIWQLHLHIRYRVLNKLGVFLFVCFLCVMVVVGCHGEGNRG